MRNNEALGMTAEKVICDVVGLDGSAIAGRIDETYEYRLREPLAKVVRELPPITQWVGLERGVRGGQSKSAVDFRTADDKTISLKTNIKGSDKVCPPEVGQPSKATFERYFGHLCPPPIEPEDFKRLCVTSFSRMLPIYVQHLLDCDYLVWVVEGRDKSITAQVVSRRSLSRINWDSYEFRFTRVPPLWTESTTVKVVLDGKAESLGELQVHSNRGSYKFRLKLRTLLRFLAHADAR